MKKLFAAAAVALVLVAASVPAFASETAPQMNNCIRACMEQGCQIGSKFCADRAANGGITQCPNEDCPYNGRCAGEMCVAAGSGSGSGTCGTGRGHGECGGTGHGTGHGHGGNR